MTEERTGAGNPERTIDLLWHEDAKPTKPARGPRRRLDVATITAAAVELADAQGIAAVTMRALASQLGLASPMALYTYVPAKAELVDLMVDSCFAAFALDTATAAPPADRIRAVADANRTLYQHHPWLADIAIERPPLGPGQLRKYEHELSALDGLGLSDHEMNLTLTLVNMFVRAHAAAAAAAGTTDDEASWWAAAGPALARHTSARDYPLSSRVGTTAGEAQGRAHDPDLAYTFGLDRIADGVQALRRRTRER